MKLKNSPIIFLIIILLLSCKQSIEPVEHEQYDLGPVLTNVKNVSEGNVWTKASPLPDSGDESHFVSFQDLLIDESDNIYVATDFAGVFLSTNDGSTWTYLNDGLKISPNVIPSQGNFLISALGIIDENIICCGTDVWTYYGLFILDKKTEEWKHTNYWNGYGIYQIIKTSKNNFVFAGGYNSLLLSTNSGTSWKAINGNLDLSSLGGYARDIDFIGNELLMATGKGIYHSSNLGEKWELLGLESEGISSIAVDSKNTIYAVTGNSKIFRLYSGSANWELIYNVSSDVGFFKSILVSANDILFLSTIDGIFRSKDYGDSWTKIGLDGISVEKILINSKGQLIAATYRKGIYISSI